MLQIPEPAIGSIFAAVVAAVASYLGLLITKESKISEFRQAWIDGLRAEVATLVSHAASVHVCFSLYSSDQQGLWEKVRDDYRLVNQSLSMIRLRLNPNEKDRAAHILKCLANLERHFEDIVQSDRKTLTDSNYDFGPHAVALEKINTELVDATQVYLKFEWQRVKKGEGIYWVTKWISLWVLVVFSLLLFAHYISAMMAN